MKKEIIIWIAWLLITLLLIIFVFNNNKKIEQQIEKPKIEQLRAEYLNKYSKEIKKIQKIIQEKNEKQKQLEKDIKENQLKENQLKECLWANSHTGAVVDCHLYFNNNKDE